MLVMLVSSIKRMLIFLDKKLAGYGQKQIVKNLVDQSEATCSVDSKRIRSSIAELKSFTKIKGFNN